MTRSQKGLASTVRTRYRSGQDSAPAILRIRIVSAYSPSFGSPLPN